MSMGWHGKVAAIMCVTLPNYMETGQTIAKIGL